MLLISLGTSISFIFLANSTIVEIPILFPKTKAIAIFFIKTASKLRVLFKSTPAFAKAKTGIIK